MSWASAMGKHGNVPRGQVSEPEGCGGVFCLVMALVRELGGIVSTSLT